MSSPQQVRTAALLPYLLDDTKPNFPLSAYFTCRHAYLLLGISSNSSRALSINVQPHKRRFTLRRLRLHIYVTFTQNSSINSKHLPLASLPTYLHQYKTSASHLLFTIQLAHNLHSSTSTITAPFHQQQTRTQPSNRQ